MASRSAGQSVKALAFLLAGLTAAKPLYDQPKLVARQDSGTTAPSSAEATTTSSIEEVASTTDPGTTSTGSASSATITSTGSISSSASTLSASGQPVVAAAAVEATVSGTARQCSVDSVTAFTSTAFVTLATTTSPLYTISLKPTLGCTCDDGWMAGIGTSMGTDGLQTVTVSSTAVAHNRKMLTD